MKSIFSILSAAVFFNGIAQPLLAADNYSLWPRRPAELEQARRLLREQKGAEAVHLLQPFIHDNGIAGREARQITGSVNVQRYLSRRHPDARVYTVKSGDNIFKIAAAEKCPFELIMLLNGIVEPAGLRVGQKLVLVPMNCRLTVDLAQRELSVWDGDILVADYPVLETSGLSAMIRKAEAPEAHLSARESYLEGVRLPQRSVQVLSGDKVLVLDNGLCIIGSVAKSTLYVKIDGRDLNELSLLLAEGAQIRIVSSANKPAATPAG